MENYRKFQKGMILRDHLALDRTLLANERTLLAYVRTFIGAFSAGVAIVKVLDSSLMFLIIGYALMCVSPVFLVAGIQRYLRVAKKLASISPSDTEE